MGTKYKEGTRPEYGAKEAIKPLTAKRTFEFPSNVKQIGSINGKVKIYIEDYAYGYIQKLGKKKGYSETAAFLIGYPAEAEGEEVLVIMGAAEPPLMSPPKDGQVFSEEDAAYAQGIIKTHFEGMQIVGWARIQPGYGLYLSASDIGNHYLNFTDKFSVLYLCDTEEKLDCFFSWNENQDDLNEVSGYFVYYDKNHGMNGFLAEGKQPGEIKERIEAPEIEEPVTAEAEKTSGASAKRARRKADVNRQKRIISMITSISMMLFFACVIMGIGLLQSGERITSVENQMRELKSGYNNIVSRLNDNSFPAFAAQKTYEEQASLETADEETADNFMEASLDQALGIVPENTEPSVDDTPLSASAENLPEQQPQPEASAPQEPPAEANSHQEAAEENNQAKGEEAEVTEYIVKSGDTLSGISQIFYGTTHNVGALMEANNISDPTKLRVGIKIIIP